MLAYLEGIIKERQNGEMIVLVGSSGQGYVGYQVKTPDHPRYETLIPGDRAEVYLYSHVREDAFDLFGFLSTYEKNLFTTLLSVSGVGPRMALSLLSHTDDANLIDMILSEDKAGLTSISGVGKKTAERMVLELKDVIQKRIDAGILRGRSSGSKGSGSQPAGATAEGAIDRGSKLFIEAYLALQGLGFKEVQAKQMVEAAFKKQVKLERVEEVVKVALQGGA
jgi:Holliday junction DNA helicase RuvA